MRLNSHLAPTRLIESKFRPDGIEPVRPHKRGITLRSITQPLLALSLWRELD